MPLRGRFPRVWLRAGTAFSTSAPAEYRHGVYDSQRRIVVVLPEQVDNADRQAALGAAAAGRAAVSVHLGCHLGPTGRMPGRANEPDSGNGGC
jgi:hypothetical protein